VNFKEGDYVIRINGSNNGMVKGIIDKVISVSPSIILERYGGGHTGANLRLLIMRELVNFFNSE